MDEHAFPLTAFAVARIGCTLQYLNAKSFISINNQESGFLVNGCGLRQGDNISPILFSMYLNDLETYFDANRINGVPVEFRADDMFIYLEMYVMLYADDTIIMSNNAESFQASKIDNDAYCVCTHDFSLCTHRKFGPVRTMYAVKISGTQTFLGFMRTQIKKIYKIVTK